MKVIDTHIMPLPSKHYSTDVMVTVSVEGDEYNLLISIREKERVVQPDWGMDHTESETHLAIAQEIVDILEAVAEPHKLSKERSDEKGKDDE